MLTGAGVDDYEKSKRQKNNHIMFTQQNNLSEKTDQEIVFLTLKNKDYYQFLVKRYEEKLLRYVIRISGLKKEDAEDILQNVFIKIYRNLNDFDRDLKFSSWAYRITHNETISYLRKLKARPKTLNPETSELVMTMLSSDFNIKSDSEKKELKDIFQKVISGLDQKYQEVVILKYIEDMDYQEISDVLKKPMGTIATLLKKAKEQLKKEILRNKPLFQEYV